MINLQLPIEEIALEVIRSNEEQYMGYQMDELINTEELAARLNLEKKSHKSTISRFKNELKYDPPLEYYKTGKEHSYKWSDVVKFMDTHLKRNARN